MDKAAQLSLQLYDIHLTGAREDAFRTPMKLYGRISALASDVNGSGIDFAPTQQQEEVSEILEGRLKDASEAIQSFMEIDLPKLNKQLKIKVNNQLIKP